MAVVEIPGRRSRGPAGAQLLAFLLGVLETFLHLIEEGVARLTR
jgi:hypothetical protein